MCAGLRGMNSCCRLSAPALAPPLHRPPPYPSPPPRNNPPHRAHPPAAQVAQYGEVLRTRMFKDDDAVALTFDDPSAAVTVQ